MTALVLTGENTSAQVVAWSLDNIRADVAHSMGQAGKGVLIGIVDSGLDARHPAFTGRVDSRSRVFLPEGEYGAIRDGDTESSHGTMVAGIAAAARRPGAPMYGVAHEASVLSLGFSDKDVESSARAIRFAVGNGVSVINGSYGPQAVPGLLIADPQDPSNWIVNPNYVRLDHQLLGFNAVKGEVHEQAEIDALRAAAAADVLMVFAAGNEMEEQPDASVHPSGNGLLPYIRPENTASGVYRWTETGELQLNDPSTYRYLDGDDPRVASLDYSDLQGYIIAVVATDRNNSISSYSNHCGVAWQWCLAAPGGEEEEVADAASQILTTAVGASYSLMTGTSAAAPFVAGAATVVRGAYPYLTAPQVSELLLTTTDTAGDLADRAIYGRGLLNLGRAIQGPREFGAEGFAQVFDVDTKGYHSSWTGDIQGRGGLTKRGAGELRMTGHNTFAGPTTILGGSLVVNGSNAVSEVTVAPAGRLAGKGTVGPTRSAGTVAPGDAGGVLTVAGDYVQQAGAVFQPVLAADAGGSRLLVNGAATLQGGRLQVELVPGALNRPYTVIQASGGITGDFADTRSGYLLLDLQRVPAVASYIVTPVRNGQSFAAFGKTRNQQSLARALDGLDHGNTLFDQLLVSRSAAALQHALTELSGELHPSVLGAMTNETALTRRAVLNRLAEPSPPAAGADPSGAWGQYLGSWGRSDSDGNAASIDSRHHGVLLGADGQFSPATRLGGALGVGRSNIHVDGQAAYAKAQHYTLSAYGATRFGSLHLRYGAAYTWHDIDSHRDLSFGQAGRSSARYKASSAQLFSELGFRQRAGTLEVEPYLGLAYVGSQAAGFQESGPYGLRASRSRQKIPFSTLGVRANHDWSFARGDLRVQGGAAWRHAYGQTSAETRMRLNNVPSFNMAGAPIGRDALMLDAGLSWTDHRGVRLNISYAGQLGRGASDHGVRAGLNWRF